MKKILIITFFIISIFLTSCSKDASNKKTNISSTSNNTTIEKYDYDINQDSFLGVGDVLVIDGRTREDIDKRIEKMKEMGVKSHRFWIRAFREYAELGDHALFLYNDTEITLNTPYYDDTIYALEKLKAAGITHITLNISWMLGKENNKYVYYGGNMPSPRDEHYNDFMDVVYETYYKIGELYNDYEYVEMGNEYNGNFLSFNRIQAWPLELKTEFILDYSYMASKGLHDASSNLKTVLNGVLDIEYVPRDETGKTFVEEHSKYCLTRFFDLLYTYIESGEYPKVCEEKSINPDDYFEVIAYHPYTFKTIGEWIKGNNDIYDVIIKHGDQGKSVFITEFGVEKINGYGGKLYKEIIDNKDKTPYIEVVHYYIFSDAVDYSLYCLVYKDKDTNEYKYTDSGQIIYDNFGIK